MAASLSGEGRLVNSKFNGSIKNLALAVFYICMGPFSFGYSIGYTSPALPEIEWKGVLEQSKLSWFTSLLTLGAMVGSIVAGFSLEGLGRKRTLMFTTLPLTAGWVLIAVGKNAFTFFLGRILTGFACGLISAAAPVYISEISSKEYRGFLGTCNQLTITIGILAVYSLGIAVDWQVLAWLGIVIPLLSNCLIATIPETPRWLLMKGRKMEARSAVSWLRGPYVDVESEINDIEENMESGKKMSWSEVFAADVRTPLKVAVIVMALQQLSGINSIMFHAEAILLQTGIFSTYIDIAAVILAGVQVLATLYSCYLMDKSGRRRLLLVGGLGMMVSCLTFGWYYSQVSQLNGPDSPLMMFVPVVCLAVYIIAFSLGWGPIPMLLMSEIFPQKARGMASSCTVLMNWSMAFLVTKTFDPLKNSIGLSGVFWMYGCFCAIGIIFVYISVPETKGKSLEDIELYFLGKSLQSRERNV